MTLLAINHYYPGFSPAAIARGARALQGIIFCRVPIYYTWVVRDNCGQNTLSKGIRTERDSNPRPSDYGSRARTNILQCSHLNCSGVYIAVTESVSCSLSRKLSCVALIAGLILYTWLFSQISRVSIRENFHVNIWLFIVIEI